MDLISNMESKSELYNALSELGAVCTESRRIREARQSFSEEFIREYPLSFSDIERVGYFNPHIRLDVMDTGIYEIWINGEYINNSEITWIEGHVHRYAILPKWFPEGTIARVIHNKYATYRYAEVQEVEGHYEHVYLADLNSFPFREMEHPDKSVYYIASGKICLPIVTKLNNNTMEFRCPYTKDIDMIVCTNLAGIFEIKAGKGTFVDNLYSTICYYHIIVEGDPMYPLDTRFYPCITADKDCTIRVYSDQGFLVPHPELTRILLYPEFMDVSDPYNTNNEYLNRLEDVDVIIYASDSDEVILDKFKELAPYCYRIGDSLPTFCNEQTDFLILDNTKFGRPTFYHASVKRTDGTIEDKIISRVPFEDYRDVLWYGNHMFHEYEILKLVKGETNITQTAIEDPRRGVPTYVIDSKYLVDNFTVIKFNAMEDTVISNIGDWIDRENIVRLHTNLNRFYRNLLVMRGSVMDEIPDDKVRISTSPPETRDEHIWFELLVNAVPEMFETDPIKIIKSFGLNPYDIPEPFRVGMYSLGLKPDDGPESYTQIIATYCEMSQKYKDYLVLEGHDEGLNGKKFNEIIHGPVDQSSFNHTVDKLHIDNPNLDTTEVIDEVLESTDRELPTEDMKPGDAAIQFEDDGIEDLLNSLDDSYDMDPIEYMNPDTGKVVSGETISNMTLEQKKNLILSYITEGTDAEKENTRIIWDYYLATMDEDILNIAVYKVLLTDYVYNIGIEHFRLDDPNTGNSKSEYHVQLEEPDADIGDYWLQLPSTADQLAIDNAKKKNLVYIMSAVEPTEKEIGMYWINIETVKLQDYVNDILSYAIVEIGYELPEGFFKKGKLHEDPDRATMGIDFHAHGHGEGPELFDEVKDNNLHQIHYGEFVPDNIANGDIWFEFLDEIDNKVCYSDTETMVVKINERLLMIEFDNDNITAFLFDDIVLNFHGKLGIRYIAILADLVNSGVIDLKSVNIFYRRLITGYDHFEPGLERLYTGRSHVISTARIDTIDYAITYSTNIGRFHMDYTDKDHVTNRERESAYRMVIDYSDREFAFIGDRMMLFVNGRYIPRVDYEEISAGKIQLKNFPEIINCVDIIYAKKDEAYSKLKNIAIRFWEAIDTSVSIQRPKKNYKHMRPINIHEKTLQGYYDVLLEEYIFNGRLYGMLQHMQEHPEEAPAIIADLKRKFHAISDTTLCGMDIDNARIIIPGFGNGWHRYEIKEDND